MEDDNGYPREDRENRGWRGINDRIRSYTTVKGGEDMRVSPESILKRLEAIEQSHQNDHMLVLAKLKTGVEVVLTVPECIRQDAVFLKVIRVGAMEELDMLLKVAFDEAWRMV